MAQQICFVSERDNLYMTAWERDYVGDLLATLRAAYDAFIQDWQHRSQTEIAACVHSHVTNVIKETLDAFVSVEGDDGVDSLLGDETLEALVQLAQGDWMSPLLEHDGAAAAAATAASMKVVLQDDVRRRVRNPFARFVAFRAKFQNRNSAAAAAGDDEV
jgi:hypothetical protein